MTGQASGLGSAPASCLSEPSQDRRLFPVVPRPVYSPSHTWQTPHWGSGSTEAAPSMPSILAEGVSRAAALALLRLYLIVENICIDFPSITQ